MKYAMVDGQRREASRELRGTCPVCGASVIAKCGKFRVWHWAHLQGNVDHRWEPETDWHLNWKRCFPKGWDEVTHWASNGERHIADVKTAHGAVIEFQHSPISDVERAAREDIYRPMSWVVDGLRLKGDRLRVYAALHRGGLVRADPLTWAVPVDKCLLLQKWAESRVRVYLDLGESDDAGLGAPLLWALLPQRNRRLAALMPVYRKAFIEAMTKGTPVKGISRVIERQPVVRQVIVSPRSWFPIRKRYRRRPIRRL